MNDIKNAQRALKIKLELAELETFISSVCDLPEESNYFEGNCLFKLRIKTKRELSVFGARAFNPGFFTGTHTAEIEVPYSLIPFLKDKACDKIRALMEEIKSL
jgi:hypothetical protein